MKTIWLMLRTEAKLSVREFSSVLFGILVPIGLILLLGILYGDAPLPDNPMIRKIDAGVGGVATLGICCAGLMGVPLTLSDYRWRKILKRYKVTPVSPLTLLSAHMLFCFALSIFSAIAVYLIAATAFGFVCRGSAILVISCYLLVMVSIHAIGLVIASLAPNAKIAGVICSLVYFVMIFISGATIPYEIMPDLMRRIADFMPLTQGIQLLNAVSLGTPPPLSGILSLTAISIIGTVIAVKFFKWE